MLLVDIAPYSSPSVESQLDFRESETELFVARPAARIRPVASGPLVRSSYREVRHSYQLHSYRHLAAEPHAAVMLYPEKRSATVLR